MIDAESNLYHQAVMKISSFAPSRASAIASKYPAALTNLQKIHGKISLKSVPGYQDDIYDNTIVQRNLTEMGEPCLM